LFIFSKAKIDGLCCLLTHPYQKLESISSINQYDLSELDRSQLVSTELLHRGKNNNQIYKGRYGQRDVAIKYQDNLDQAKIMEEFSHKNLVRLYGVCTQDEPILIVMELMKHGCLLEYLRDQSRINLKLETIVDFIGQVNNEEI
jgi:serine/threonine protein kinase